MFWKQNILSLKINLAQKNLLLSNELSLHNLLRYLPLKDDTDQYSAPISVASSMALDSISR